MVEKKCRKGGTLYLLNVLKTKTVQSNVLFSCPDSCGCTMVSPQLIAKKDKKGECRPA